MHFDYYFHAMSGGDWKEMLVAVQSGDFELVKYHIQNGVDPNYEHPELLTNALIESVQYDHIDIARYLLENGANPKQNAWMSTDNPLSVAKAMKKKEFVRLFKSYGSKNWLQRIFGS